MNIEDSTNNDQDEEQEPANENAMYNNPSLVGLSPQFLNDSANYQFNLTDAIEDSTSPVLTERERFYRSYNPNVGLHTAAVLGGILVWVIIYLFYRTKCKKAVIRLIREKRKKDKVFAEKEVMGRFIPTTVEQTCGLLEHSTIGGFEQKFFGKDFVIDQIQASIECQKLIVNEHNYSPTTDDQHSKWNQTELPSPVLLPTCNLSSPSVTTLDLHQMRQQRLIQQLPSVETDIAQATAQWVQDQPLSSQSASFQDISGVILKVQPHTVRNHIPGSCPLDSLTLRHNLTPVTPKTWNKSMPILSENLHISCEELSVEKKTNYKEDKKVKVLPKLTIPIPDLKEFSSSSRLNAYSPVPIPVTPTVMIQNFTSKGNTKNSPLHRNNSNDSMTSNSSEDPLLAQPQMQIGWVGKNMITLPRTKDSDCNEDTQCNTSHLHPIIKIDSMETKL
ncbi:uncharacterized protein LOC124254654 [Haliotis rubra]|uniref:uncharacterized protein LOC124254654 n=1 Tax=Haliotis rubra TaxID=36100 RepID=UPI001EE5B9D7|nr:uncharacterized protein LOC124254654 [Haliotis rubra]